MKKILGFGIAMAILLATVAVAAAETRSYGPVRVVTADDFETSVDGLISGWYWLRDSGYEDYGQWKFSNIPESKTIYVYATPLVTNTVSGGSGYSAIVEIEYTDTSGNPVTDTMELQNTHPEIQQPDNTNGYGYHMPPMSPSL